MEKESKLEAKKNMSKRMQDRRIDIRLPPYQYQTIRELAKEYNTSLSMMIRTLLRKALDDVISENDEQENNISDSN